MGDWDLNFQIECGKSFARVLALDVVSKKNMDRLMVTCLEMIQSEEEQVRLLRLRQ